MRNRKIGLLVGSGLIMCLLFLAIYNKSPNIALDICSPNIEIDGMQQSIHTTFMRKDGLYDQIGQRLHEKGYNHRILAGISSEEKIFVKIVLVDQKANAQRQKKVKEVFYTFIRQNDLDPNAFKVKVSNDETLNW